MNDTRTSGIAARVDTTSMPMTNLLMPKLRDTATALSVISLAPWFRTTNPIATIGTTASDNRSNVSHPLYDPLPSRWFPKIYGFLKQEGRLLDKVEDISRIGENCERGLLRHRASA